MSQYGIPWTFESPVEAGRYITGDRWGVGLVTVTSVAPGPGTAQADEQFEAASGVWGDTSY